MPKKDGGSTKSHSSAGKGSSLPDFLIIGAQKCGTSSLYWSLATHPQIVPASRKEVHFFDTPHKWFRGLEFYRSHFPATEVGVLTGEASAYYLYHPLAARRAARVVPGAKLVVVLRNPVDRAYSDYQQRLSQGFEDLDFDEAIEMEAQRLAGERERMLADPHYKGTNYRRYSYLARGVYLPQIMGWRRCFGASSMMILKSESFYASPLAHCERIIRFLGLPEGHLKPIKRGFGRVYPPMSSETRRRLADYFRPHNRRLYRYLDEDFGW